MIGQVCAECKNYFIQPDVDIHASNYTVTNGQIGPVPFLKNGQYYRIVGSTLNDGVYQHGVDDTALSDEEFFGAVWAMRVPRDFVALCEEIQAWESKYSSALESPYTSESMPTYSRSMKTGSNGGSYTWQDHFRNRLRAYTRLSVL